MQNGAKTWNNDDIIDQLFGPTESSLIKNK
jgi:hypothetical protein